MGENANLRLFCRKNALCPKAHQAHGTWVAAATTVLLLKGCFIDLHGGSDPFIHTNAFIGACSTEMLSMLGFLGVPLEFGTQLGTNGQLMQNLQIPRYGNAFHFYLKRRLGFVSTLYFIGI